MPTGRPQFAAYAEQFPDLAEQCRLVQARELSQGMGLGDSELCADAKGVGTRVSSGKVPTRSRLGSRGSSAAPPIWLPRR